MGNVHERIEWLRLIDVSGPFLAGTVLEEAFPQGLETVETPRRQRLRSAYEEWREAIDEGDDLAEHLHRAWTRMVIQEALEYEDQVLVDRKGMPKNLAHEAAEHGVKILPDFAVRTDDGIFRLLVTIYPPGTDLAKPMAHDKWPASPAERMTLLCRTCGVRTGLVTDGEQWMLVNAPVGSTSGTATWLARLWWQEPITLKAFQSLLGVRRCFGSENLRLDKMLERSLEYQEEVTDTLGEQVRRAVEILIQSLGRADQDRNGELLKEVQPAELYEAGLTVMMRMVFTLCAEERGLLLLDDPVYDQHYAISTLRARLREDAERYGVEVLERRHDAWSRMLAVFRAIYGGVEHESLRMPALGGSLFDPDRFPLLEGRGKGTTWRDTPAIPLSIDNRTVLLLLDALQVLEQKGGAQYLSYRALDVEQIGHVYEGLLECTVAKLDEVTVGLVGSQKFRRPSIMLSELETLTLRGLERTTECLVEKTGRSAAAIRKALSREDNEESLVRLVHACSGDEKLAHRLLPFADLIRADSWGTLLVYKPGWFAVVHGSDRRDTGTHYTPQSLTETIVEKALEPVVYLGPAKGKPRGSWTLREPIELLDLKICDPAMGSGAFLVQVCRYLSERLVEAWAQKETEGKAITEEGIVLELLGEAEPMPESQDVRLVIARRLIAERVLYGVDINPMAVELAKLSIWLVTMAKGRPFGFLDHNLRAGDSLFGIHRLDQVTKLTMSPDESGCQPRLFGQSIGDAVKDALAIRAKLRAVPIHDIQDVEMMAHFDAEARMKLEPIELVADAMLGASLTKSEQPESISSTFDSLALMTEEFLRGEPGSREHFTELAREWLTVEFSGCKVRRKPFHWPIAFPEVFAHGRSGFDSIVGNPPFLGGQRITGVMGSQYREFLVRELAASVRGSADLVAYFVLRVNQLLAPTGVFGLITCNTIAEGDTRQVCLDQLIAPRNSATIISATPNLPWPGKAAVMITLIHVAKGPWDGIRLLSGVPVTDISPFLSDRVSLNPKRLFANSGKSFIGSQIQGKGFMLTHNEAKGFLNQNPNYSRVVLPYLRGEDYLDSPTMSPDCWVINFYDWPLTSPNGGPQALDFPDLVERLKATVKPQRESKAHTNAIARKRAQNWWQYGSKAGSLYSKIKGLTQVIFHPFTSKFLAFGIVPSAMVFAAPHIVIASSDYGLLAVLCSCCHEVWVRTYTSHLGGTARYTPSDCFETYPFPNTFSEELTNLGRKFSTLRQAIMQKNRIGLTAFYNNFHNQNCIGQEIEQIRELQEEVNVATLNCYGWGDLHLTHDFNETPQGVRYTIIEPNRRDILNRLMTLNHEKYAEEEKSDFKRKKSHDKKNYQGFDELE